MLFFFFLGGGVVSGSQVQVIVKYGLDMFATLTASLTTLVYHHICKCILLLMKKKVFFQIMNSVNLSIFSIVTLVQYLYAFKTYT